MGKHKDQEGNGKRIYGMFSICHLQMLEDWHLIERGHDLRLYLSCCLSQPRSIQGKSIKSPFGSEMVNPRIT